MTNDVLSAEVRRGVARRESQPRQPTFTQNCYREPAIDINSHREIVLRLQILDIIMQTNLFYDNYRFFVNIN